MDNAISLKTAKPNEIILNISFAQVSGDEKLRPSKAQRSVVNGPTKTRTIISTLKKAIYCNQTTARQHIRRFAVNRKTVPEEKAIVNCKEKVIFPHVGSGIIYCLCFADR